MNIRRTDRLWMLGGLFGIIVLVVAAYLLAIKPIYADKADKESQVDDQELALVTLRTQLNQLKAKAKNQATYTAQLNARTAAMPDSYDVPNYLRALQTSGTAAKVIVSGISVGAPTKLTRSALVRPGACRFCSRCDSWSTSDAIAETSRCTFDGK